MSELPDPIRDLAQRYKEAEASKMYVPSMYQPHAPGVTLSYPGNATPTHIMGGSTIAERGKAARMREQKHETFAQVKAGTFAGPHALEQRIGRELGKLNRITHDNDDGHTSVNVDYAFLNTLPDDPYWNY